MVLPPHEDAAPVGQVVRHDGQPVPPGLHHRLHVVQAVAPPQVGRLQARVYLRGFLELNDLLGGLSGTDTRGSAVSLLPKTTHAGKPDVSGTLCAERISQFDPERKSLTHRLPEHPRLARSSPPALLSRSRPPPQLSNLSCGH